MSIKAKTVYCPHCGNSFEPTTWPKRVCPHCRHEWDDPEFLNLYGKIDQAMKGTAPEQKALEYADKLIKMLEAEIERQRQKMEDQVVAFQSAILNDLALADTKSDALNVANQLIDQYKEATKYIPPCPSHGPGCIPWIGEWAAQMERDNKELEARCKALARTLETHNKQVEDVRAAAKLQEFDQVMVNAADEWVRTTKFGEVASTIERNYVAPLLKVIANIQDRVAHA